jgi:sugar phosphate isomerase/epimerase
MLQFTSANQLKLNSGACIDATATDRELGIRALVGYHHYTRIDSTDAVQRVQESVDAAGLNWVARHTFWNGTTPDGAVRVGQFRVRGNDPEMILYVAPRKA